MSASQVPTPALLSDRAPALSGRRRAALFAALGAVAALGHPPLGWPVLTVLGLVAFFALAPWRLSPRAAAWAGWAFGLGYFAVTLHWIVEPFLVDIARHGWMAPFAIALMSGGLALFWAGALALGAWRRSGLVTVLALALAELARAHVFGGFPWGMFVAAFVDTALYQAAAWLGPHGLTLVLLLAVLAASHLPRLLGAVTAAALAGLTLVPPPAAAPPAANAPILRAVQPNAPQDEKWDPDRIPVFFARKLRATAAQPDAALIVWPESSLPTWLEYGAPSLATAAAEARRAELLIGAQSLRDGIAYNALAQVGADGALIDTYDKHHLVPFGEYMPLGALFARLGIHGLAAKEGFGFAPGPGPEVMDVAGIGLVQPLICYEGIFAHEVGRGVPRPRLIAISTNDAWFGQWGGPRQHLAQAQARALEQGLPVVRSANTGVSAIIDARGGIVASLALGQSGHVDAPLPAARAPTLYARMGDTAFWLLAAILITAHALLPRIAATRQNMD
ncbi:MAG: apolipoprotein N-acyltransferase [Pseudomonadota bacterium]